MSLKADMMSSVERKSWNAAPFEPGVPVAVVSLPLVRVGEDLVRFGRLLEPLGGLLVTRVAVRVILERHLPIGFLDIVGGGLAGDPEHLVEIAFRCGHRHGVSGDWGYGERDRTSPDAARSGPRRRRISGSLLLDIILLAGADRGNLGQWRRDG